MNIAIIPARGGSKRIPRKNIKAFGGKPMIAYAITTAKNSGLFDRVLVSTDDEEIAVIAQAYGAETPFVRPVELANDFTATVPVIAHAIQACEGLGWHFSKVCCIYPGVPFIEVADLQGAFMRLEQGGVDYCFPVSEFPSAIQRALKKNSNGVMQSLYPEFQLTRTQDLEPAYYDAGQFYWGKKETWLSNSKIHSNCAGYVIPNWRVVDIDTPADWERAELVALAIRGR
jgi:pseudaminic acid cytidylyltransferase